MTTNSWPPLRLAGMVLPEALGVDDRQFVTEFRMSDGTYPGGMVRVTIQEVAA